MGMRRAAAAVALMLLLSASSSAQAQVSTYDQVGSPTSYQYTSSGFFANHYEVTSTVWLGVVGTWVWTAAQENVTHLVYESSSESGPYTLFWSSSPSPTAINGLQVSPPVNMNLTAGNHYLIGAFVEDTNSGPGNLATWLNPPGTEAVSFGTASSAVADTSVPGPPAVYTPTFYGELHRQNIQTLPASFPPVAEANGPYTAYESSPTILFDATGSTDPDGDLNQMTWRCRADTLPTFGCVISTWPTMTASYTYANDDGVYTVELLVIDDYGNTDTDTTTVTILNEAPTVVASCVGSCAVDEGSPLSFTCSGTDPGVDQVQLTWTYSDTGATQTGQQNNFPTSYTFVDDGSFTATCSGDDLEGGTDSEVLSVTIANVAPTLGAVNSTPSGDEGSALAFSTVATDPGADVLTYTWDWGDGTTSTGASTTHAWADEGSYTTSVVVDDGDGANDSSSPVTVTINNVAPVLSVSCPGSLEEGTALALGVSQFDPGMDTWTWSLSGAPAGLTLTPGVGGTTATLDWTPGFADIALGSFGFTLSVDDGDGGSDSETCSGIALTYLDDDADGLPDTWEATNSVSDPAGDPDADGRDNITEWGAGTDPNVYDGPDVPTPTSPLNGEDITSTTPSLTWDNATNGPGDALTYDVEVFSDASGSALVTSVDGLTEGAGTTSWTVDVALSDNAPGSWRVRASDVYVDGAWSAVTPFFVDLVNEPPSVPVLVGPPDGGIVTDAGVDLELGASADPEGDDFVYTIEVYSDEALTEQVLSEDVAGPAAPTRSFSEAAEDTLYWWRARAVDVEGEASEWGGPWQLLWSTVDDAPPAPHFVWPEDGGQAASEAPVFELDGGADPEALPVEFEIELAEDETFSAPIASGRLLEDSPGAVAWDSSVVTTPYVEDVLGWARARAVDPGGLESDWTSISFTPNAQNDPPTAPTLESPVGGVEVSGVVDLVIGNATDSDGNRRSYEFEVMVGGELFWGVSIDEAPGGTTVTVDDGTLEEGSYSWRARALDDLELAGPWAEEESFTYVFPTDDDSDEDTTEACACESSLVPQGGGWFALAFGVLVFGRRRRR